VNPVAVGAAAKAIERAFRFLPGQAPMRQSQGLLVRPSSKPSDQRLMRCSFDLPSPYVECFCSRWLSKRQEADLIGFRGAKSSWCSGKSSAELREPIDSPVLNERPKKKDSSVSLFGESGHPSPC